jgi:hypothetical protein
LRPLLVVAVIVIAVGLVGCARWHRPGTSQEAFLADRLECREEARVWKPRRGVLYETWQIDQDRFALCMRRRGYSRGRPSSPPGAEGSSVASPPPSRD